MIYTISSEYYDTRWFVNCRTEAQAEKIVRKHLYDYYGSEGEEADLKVEKHPYLNDKNTIVEWRDM